MSAVAHYYEANILLEYVAKRVQGHCVIALHHNVVQVLERIIY